MPLSEAKARLSERKWRCAVSSIFVITLTRYCEAEAVLLSVDDLEGMEMTLEILGGLRGGGAHLGKPGGAGVAANPGPAGTLYARRWSSGRATGA